MFRPFVGSPAAAATGARPSVSVIVAAKDEADTLKESLESLVGLEYEPKEVIVVCPPSGRETREVADEFGGSLAVLQEPERPPDWIGKSWACHQGYARSKGELLLFTDGDVVHSRESLGLAVARLESARADLLSVWPGVATRAPSERMVLPSSLFFLCAGVAVGFSARTSRGRRVRGANGQYILVRRGAYESIGGHSAVRRAVMEDGALGKLALEKGLEVVNENGEGFLVTKPFSGFAEVWAAHERYGAGLIGSWGLLVATGALTVAYYVLPFALLALGVVGGSSALAVGGGAAAAAVLSTQGFFALKVSRLRYLVLAPLSGLVVLAAFVTGFVKFRRGGIVWKGSVYGRNRFESI